MDDLGSFVIFLRSLRIPHSTEKEMQDAIEKAFKENGVGFSREHRLSDKDVIDFWIPRCGLSHYDPENGTDVPCNHNPIGIGIECKVKGQPMAIHRQAERYLKYDEVGAIIIVTAKHMGTTGSHNGKPIAVVQAGRSWL